MSGYVFGMKRIVIIVVKGNSLLSVHKYIVYMNGLLR